MGPHSWSDWHQQQCLAFKLQARNMPPSKKKEGRRWLILLQHDHVYRGPGAVKFPSADVRGCVAEQVTNAPRQPEDIT